MPPVPAGRGRWYRFVLCDRYGVDPAELVDAYSRNAVFDVSKPAQTTFVISGRSPQVPDIGELYTDLRAWRWNDNTGADDLMFRGRIGQTQDTLSADSHVVKCVTALADYRAMLTRRVNPFWLFWTRVEQLQDRRGPHPSRQHPQLLLDAAAASGTNADLGIRPAGRLNPDSSPLGAGAVTMLRDRVYVGGETVGSLIDDPSKPCQRVRLGDRRRPRRSKRPGTPQRGATITAWAAEYGSTVAALSRTVELGVRQPDPGDRQSGLTSPSRPCPRPPTRPAWSDRVATPWGIWQSPGAYPDISDQTTLDQQAAGLLAADALLEPSYVLEEPPPAAGTRRTAGLATPSAPSSTPAAWPWTTLFRLQTVAFDISDDGNRNQSRPHLRRRRTEMDRPEPRPVVAGRPP